MRFQSVSRVVALVALFGGCSSQGTALKGIEATGTATLDGTPLEMGLIVFEPEGGGESSSSQITKDGNNFLTLFDGLSGFVTLANHFVLNIFLTSFIEPVKNCLFHHVKFIH
jgi:hypothetical protein